MFKHVGASRREEGLLGLWKGVTPNIGRNAIINAAELASYDSVGPHEALFTASAPTFAQDRHPS
jgi:hypothetical protein